MSRINVSRRGFLRMSAVGFTGILAACTPKVVKETVLVEKQVEKVVEKEVTTVVKETVVVQGTPQVVEKVITVAPQTAEELLASTPGLMPGCPGRVKGWKTTLPDLPPGTPWTPPIVIRMAKRTQQAVRYLPGDDVDNNPWTRMYKELFGIEWKAAYTFVGGEQQQKLSLAMAANDLPDVHNDVPISLALDLIEADMIEDITDAYDIYCDAAYKQSYNWGDGIPWMYYMIDGRKWGIPNVEIAAKNEKALILRQDWLDKLGMKAPETLDELHDVALAFAQNDLGQGAPGTTWGLLACQQIQTWMGSLDPIFGAYRVMPYQWAEDGKGGLTWGGTDPRSKEVLGLLSQWYQEGIFAADYYTIHVRDSRNQIFGNTCGMHLSQPVGLRLARDSVTNDPTAVWTWTDIPTGPTGERGCYWQNPATQGGVIFRKGFEHLDKVLLQANFDLRLLEDPWRRMHGWCDRNIIWDGDRITEDVGWKGWAFGCNFNVGGSSKSPDTGMNEIRFRQEYAKTTPRDKWDAFMEYELDDPSGLRALEDSCRVFVTERTLTERTIKNAFLGLPTPAMRERVPDLQTIQDEVFHGIITGNLPLSAFDTFVENWKRQGGDQVTREASEWFAQRR